MAVYDGVGVIKKCLENRNTYHVWFNTQKLPCGRRMHYQLFHEYSSRKIYIVRRFAYVSFDLLITRLPPSCWHPRSMICLGFPALPVRSPAIGCLGLGVWLTQYHWLSNPAVFAKCLAIYEHATSYINVRKTFIFLQRAALRMHVRHEALRIRMESKRAF